MSEEKCNHSAQLQPPTDGVMCVKCEIDQLREFCEDLMNLLEKAGFEAEVGDGVSVKTIRQAYEQIPIKQALTPPQT